MKIKFIKRLCTVVLSASMLMTSIQVAAAPVSTDTLIQPTYDQALASMVSSGEATTLSNSETAQIALDALNDAIKSGNLSDYMKAYKLIYNLTPTQKIHLYRLRFGSYYAAHYLDKDFNLFDVDAYMAANPDTYDSSRSLAEQRVQALEHYLNYGIFEGRGSYTDFDPVVAILVQPDAVINAIASSSTIDKSVVNSIETAYAEAEGSPTTTQYNAYINKLSAVNGNLDFNEFSLVSLADSVKNIDWEEPESSSESTDDDDEPRIVPAVSPEIEETTEEETTEEETEEATEPTLTAVAEATRSAIVTDAAATAAAKRDIDNARATSAAQNIEAQATRAARATEAAQATQAAKATEAAQATHAAQATQAAEATRAAMLTSAATVTDTPTLTPTDTVTSGVTPTVTSRITAGAKSSTITKSTTKTVTPIAANTSAVTETDSDFTLMVYMSGTDLESDMNDLPTGTRSILSMLAASVTDSNSDLSNVNTMLCLGGCSNWRCSYLDSLDNCKMGVYEINWSGLDTDFENAITVTDANGTHTFADADDILSYYANDLDTLVKNANLVDAIINSNTMTEYYLSDGSVEFGNWTNLTSFMDLTADVHPDDEYGLVLWNHGGGVIDGILATDSYIKEDGAESSTDGMSMSDLYQALYYSDIYQSGLESGEANKLSFLGMDACLMGGIDVAYMFSEFTSDMVLSPNVECTDWDYAAVISAISSSMDKVDAETALDTDALARDIVVADADRIKDASVATAPQTLVALDSDMVDSFMGYINNYAGCILEMLDNYYIKQDTALYSALVSAIRKAEIYAYDYGYVDTDYIDSSSSYIDIADYLDNMQSELNSVINAYQAKTDKDATVSEALTAYQTNCESAFTEICNCKLILAADLAYEEELTTTATDGGSTIMDVAVTNYNAWNGLMESDLGMLSIYSFGQAWKVGNDIYTGLYESNASSYLQLVKSMYNYNNSDAESARRERLASAIDYDKVFDTSDVDANGVRSYRSYNDNDYVKIKLVSASSYAQEDTVVADSSGDPYVDVIDTVNYINAYAARNASATKTTDEGGTEDISLNILIGKSVINPQTLSGNVVDDKENGTTTTSSITVMQSDLSNVTALLALGKLASDASSDSGKYDWAYADTCYASMIKALDDSLVLEDIDTSTYRVVRGALYNAITDEETNTTNYTAAEGTYYHIFKVDGFDTTYYNYCGTVNEYSESEEATGYSYQKLTSSGTSDSSNILSFYHYYVDDNEVKVAEDNGITIENTPIYTSEGLELIKNNPLYDKNGALYDSTGVYIGVESNEQEYVIDGISEGDDYTNATDDFVAVGADEVELTWSSFDDTSTSSIKSIETSETNVDTETYFEPIVYHPSDETAAETEETEDADAKKGEDALVTEDVAVGDTEAADSEAADDQNATEAAEGVAEATETEAEETSDTDTADNTESTAEEAVAETETKDLTGTEPEPEEAGTEAAVQKAEETEPEPEEVPAVEDSEDSSAAEESAEETSAEAEVTEESETATE